MCDEFTAADNERQGLTRREFGAGGGAAGLAMLWPSAADAASVKGRDVAISTPDGSADAYHVAPARGRHPGVLMWPDIMGLRPAFRQMADRLAEAGYAVLVVNQFYRATRAPFLGAGESYDQPAVRARIAPWREALTPAAVARDAAAFTRFLEAQRGTDRKRPLASTGYCMGGPMAFRTAAARPDRVRAIASFHGAALVTDAADSPHRLVGQMQARALIAIAKNDDERAPGDKAALRQAFADARHPAEIEVYPALHGWCPPDSRVYDAVQAERAWGRMLALLTAATA